MEGFVQEGAGDESMKGIVLTGDWGPMVRDGIKSIETRTWSTSWRGLLLICVAKSSPSRFAGLAIAVVELADCREMIQADEPHACCEIYPDAKAWVLRNVRPIIPFRPVGVKCWQRLFDVDVIRIDANRIVYENQGKDTNMTDQKDAGNDGQTSGQTVEIDPQERLKSILQADAEVETATKEVKRIAEELKFAKADQTTALNKRNNLCHEARKGTGLFPEMAMGAIGPETRIGRRFNIADTDARVEFKGIDQDDNVLMDWVDGEFEGESFFPAGDVSVDDWNKEWAPKVLGYSDPIDPSDGEETSETSDSEENSRSEDDGWRKVPLDQIQRYSGGKELTTSTIKKLAEHDPSITTVGELEDHRKKHGRFWAKKIDGVGPTIANAIEEVLIEFHLGWKKAQDEKDEAA